MIKKGFLSKLRAYYRKERKLFLLTGSCESGGHSGGGRLSSLLVDGLESLLFLGLILSTDGQRDLVGLTINAHELSLNGITDLKDGRYVVDTIAGNIGSSDVTDDVISQGDGSTASINLGNGTGDDGALTVLTAILSKRIGGDLLEPQGDTLTLRIYLQYYSGKLVTLGEVANCLFTVLLPGNVREVNQAVDTAVQADEDTEIGNGLDLTGNTLALGVLLSELDPRIYAALLNTQGDATTLLIDIKTLNRNVLTDGNNL